MGINIALIFLIKLKFLIDCIFTNEFVSVELALTLKLRNLAFKIKLMFWKQFFEAEKIISAKRFK